MALDFRAKSARQEARSSKYDIVDYLTMKLNMISRVSDSYEKKLRFS